MQTSTSAPAAGTRRAMSPPAAARSSRPPCRFFLLGKCKFGDACTFSHDPQRVPVCSFFENAGTCRYGNSCKFLHGSSGGGGGGNSGGNSGGSSHDQRSASATTASAPLQASSGASESTTPAAQQQQQQESNGASSSDRASAGGDVGVGAVSATGAAAGAAEAAEEGEDRDKCGICLENIPASGKRFGLLNCDHVYCLECLRTWRKSKGPQKDISRTCPECRKVSFFLVPSKEHLKGRAKLKAIQAYKKGLSKLPCKYHKPARSGSNGGGGGSSTSRSTSVCPFGARCFYAHLDENGNDVKDRTPPAQPASSRRTCPYLRGGGGGGGSRGGARGGARGGGGGGGGRAGQEHGFGEIGGGALDHLHLLYPFEGEEFAPDMTDSYGRQISVIMRLQALMLENAQDFL